jgi:hypothetical protein
VELKEIKKKIMKIDPKIKLNWKSGSKEQKAP